MALNREQILEKDDLVVEEVSVPEWGDTVFVRSMTSLEREELEAQWFTPDGTPKPHVNIRAELVAQTAVDEAGERLFTAEDVAALAEKNAMALTRVFRVAQRLSAMNKEALEDFLGNSEDIPSTPSDSD